MKTSTFINLLVACASITSCNRNEKFLFALEGHVKNARTGSSLGEAHIEFSQQEISGGTFNDNFVEVAHLETDGGGHYRIEFERENVVEYKLEVNKDQYIGRTFSFVPDDFEIDGVTTKNVSLYPEAYIELHLHNEMPSLDTDVMNFRFDQVNFDCLCCNGDWIQLTGAAADTQFTCKLYGETWLRYVRQIATEEFDTLLVDSIWCPSFITTQLDISY